MFSQKILEITIYLLDNNQQMLMVATHLTPWLEAFYGASWCEKSRQKGQWVRVDDGSYPVDCLDSAEYAAIPYKKLLLNA